MYGKYRYTICSIQDGDELNAIGMFRTRPLAESAVAGGDAQAELDGIRHLLAELRGCAVESLEWDVLEPGVRAQQTALKSTGATEMHLLGKPEDRRPLNLSTKPRGALLRQHLFGAIGAFMFSLIFGAMVIFGLTH